MYSSSSTPSWANCSTTCDSRRRSTDPGSFCDFFFNGGTKLAELLLDSLDLLSSERDLESDLRRCFLFPCRLPRRDRLRLLFFTAFSSRLLRSDTALASRSSISLVFFFFFFFFFCGYCLSPTLSGLPPPSLCGYPSRPAAQTSGQRDQDQFHPGGLLISSPRRLIASEGDMSSFL